MSSTAAIPHARVNQGFPDSRIGQKPMARRPVFVRIRYAHPEVPLRDGERYNFCTGWMGRAALSRFWDWSLKIGPMPDALVEFKRLPSGHA